MSMVCRDLFSLPVHTKGQVLPSTSGTTFFCLKTLGLSFPVYLIGRRVPDMRCLKVLEDGDPGVENIVIIHRLLLELEGLMPLPFLISLALGSLNSHSSWLTQL